MNQLDLADGLRMLEATRGDFLDHKAHLRFVWAASDSGLPAKHWPELDGPRPRATWVEPDLLQLL